MPAPTRRTALALGALTGVLLLGGCTGEPPAKPGASAAAADADRPLRLRQLAATDALLADYDAALAAAPAEAQRLGDLRDDVARHREALAGPLPSASASAPASTAAPAGAATVAALAAAEQRTAAARLADLDAASPELARTLASIAASDSAHAAALGDTALTLNVTQSPTASPSASPSAVPAADTAALQNALAAEHAAVYGYGVVGAFLPTGPQREDARTTYAAHQARRDTWQRVLSGTGASPTAAAAGYRLPFQVKDAPTATQLAAYLETQLTAAYADLAAAPAYRAAAATALRDSTLRAAHWGADLPALPGLADQ
ncbi:MULTISPECIES: ferritin-like domain-containing protein [Kitasatospora]|uniref:DUF4439 domain-containing protein n=1 Tax=Kitasatospora setae (strain ATCC 33774 / DSM 43861 / JCM 3304 / KCC A-0304 / NBRC 14216 / KM-6054) TaxID=452652 RepID=E4NHU9_KITSK|nr:MULTISPECIES: ferritin-like domain-containing protein [Kitasatospora]BAJ31079.1 hypothetical protein KSE_53030 [Kitasatospora setae KM-6054]